LFYREWYLSFALGAQLPRAQQSNVVFENHQWASFSVNHLLAELRVTCVLAFFDATTHHFDVISSVLFISFVPSIVWANERRYNLPHTKTLHIVLYGLVVLPYIHTHTDSPVLGSTGQNDTRLSLQRQAKLLSGPLKSSVRGPLHSLPSFQRHVHLILVSVLWFIQHEMLSWTWDNLSKCIVKQALQNVPNHKVAGQTAICLSRPAVAVL